VRQVGYQLDGHLNIS